MIDEVLKKVTEAEEAAAAIQARADSAYAKKKEEVRLKAKEVRASVLSAAEEQAAASTAAANAAAEASAEALLSSLQGEIERLATQMTGRITNGNC